MPKHFGQNYGIRVTTPLFSHYDFDKIVLSEKAMTLRFNPIHSIKKDKCHKRNPSS